MPLWLSIAGLLALCFFPIPSERAERAARAATLHEYLGLRASRFVPVADAIGDGLPSLAVAPLSPRALELAFPAPSRSEAVLLDPLIGPYPRPGAAGGALPWEGGSAPLVLLAGDRGLDRGVGGAEGAADFAERLRAALPSLASSLAPELATSTGGGDLELADGRAAGQSPLGHLGLLERCCARRVALIVSVWNLADDLAETDVLRRVHELAPPGGDVDALVRELGDPSAAEDAQERWLATHAEAREAVRRVLVTVGFELERRAWLHAGDAALVLLVPPGAGPATREVIAGVRRGLEARGVTFLVASASGAERDDAALLADLVAEIERSARERRRR